MTHISRIAGALVGLAAAVIACLATAPAAFAYRVPAPGGHAGPAQTQLQVHTIVTGGMPGWQIALIAVGAAAFAAVLAVTADRVVASHHHHTTTAPGT